MAQNTDSKRGRLQQIKTQQLGQKTGSPQMFPQEQGDRGRGRFRKQAKRLNRKPN